MNAEEKKARRRAYRDQERQAARSRLPLDDPEMEALFDMLDDELPRKGCDHTRTLTDAWLMARGHPTAGVHRWLDENHGFCDCEVLANCEEAWRSATRRR
jgi:hypothetical protein